MNSNGLFVYSIYINMSSSAISLPLEIQQADILISFAIRVLTECDRTKLWKKLSGRSAETCGYTGPGIGILLQIFTYNQISNEYTLRLLLQKKKYSMPIFMGIVNETIGNLLDLSTECPVTQTRFGIRGLILQEQSKPIPDGEMSDGDEEHQKVYKVTIGGEYLVPGPNIISFTGRAHFGCETFHHACLYIIPKVNTCYIIDSWRSDIHTARPLTSRRHDLLEVISIIDELNSDTITMERTFQILSVYFLAHIEATHKMLLVFNNIMVHTINPSYIKHIYNECETAILTGVQPDTYFGGKPHKRYKNRRTTRGNNRHNKKYRTKKYKSNRKYKIYRGTRGKK